jgi:hypothetical protein
LTRYREQLTGERNRIHNRIHKVLEDANIKLDTVLSDLLGVSGRAMLRAIVNGHCDPGWLADYARGSLRGKREQLELVLRGQIQDHHRYRLGELLADLEFVESKILRLEQELLRRMEPYQDLINRLCSIPGVELLTAWTLVAELGPDMTVFPDAAHAASWAGLCPGNRESAGNAAFIQRCQVHKLRNVAEHLPEPERARLKFRSAPLTRNRSADARDALYKLHDELMRSFPAAADSLMEGLEETLTLEELGVRSRLKRSLTSTDLIESCFSTVERICHQVKRWQRGDHRLRWSAQRCWFWNPAGTLSRYLQIPALITRSKRLTIFACANNMASPEPAWPKINQKSRPTSNGKADILFRR